LKYNIGIEFELKKLKSLYLEKTQSNSMRSTAMIMMYKYQRWVDCKIFQSESSPDPRNF